MPVFTCKDCKKSVSTDANFCPHCGKDFREVSHEQKISWASRRSKAKITSSILMLSFSSIVIVAGLLLLLIFWPAGICVFVVGIIMLYGAL